MIVKKSSGRKPAVVQKQTILVIGIILVLLGSGLAWYLLRNTSTATTVKAQQQNYTARVQRSSIKDSAAGSGTLSTAQTDNLSFTEDGVMNVLNVRVGDKVKTGDVLGSLANQLKMEASVASAELKVLTAQQSLNSLQKQASMSVVTAYEDWLMAKNTYDDAVLAEFRTKGSRCSKVVTMRYVNQLKNKTDNFNSVKDTPNIEEYKNAEYAYQTALANFEYCTGYSADEKTKASATRQVAETAMNEAETKYQTLKKASGIDPDELSLAEAGLKAAQTQLSFARKNLASGTLTATMEGTVVAVNARQGASVVAGDTIITLADLDHLYLEVNVNESDYDKMVVGTKAEVIFSAIPKKTYTGKVTLVEPEIVKSGQYRFVQGLVELDTPASSTVSPLLGMNATVKIITKEINNALFVPAEALRTIADGEYAVFVVSSDGSMNLRTVKIGYQDKNRVEITAGLSEGETVSTGIASTTSSK